MASDDMRVRLHLRQVRVLAVVVDTPSELVVEVESTLRRLRCVACGFKCHRVHDRRRRKVRDLEVSGRRTTLVWMRRRLSCGNCGERFLEDHPEFVGRLTRRLARRLVADARVMPISAAARRHALSWHLVMALVRSWADLVAEHRRSRRCRVLLVDETSMRRRHRYVGPSRKRGMKGCWHRLGSLCHEDAAGFEIRGVGEAVGGASQYLEQVVGSLDSAVGGPACVVPGEDLV